jgi:hypothetical protein
MTKFIQYSIFLTFPPQPKIWSDLNAWKGNEAKIFKMRSHSWFENLKLNIWSIEWQRINQINNLNFDH